MQEKTKKAIADIALNAGRAAALAVAVAAINQMLNGKTFGDRKIVLFTASK